MGMSPRWDSRGGVLASVSAISMLTESSGILARLNAAVTVSGRVWAMAGAQTKHSKAAGLSAAWISWAITRAEVSKIVKSGWPKRRLLSRSGRKKKEIK